MGRLLTRSLLSLASIAIATFVAYKLIPVNATTAGFAYLLVVLVIASIWGFVEAVLASIFATLTFNYFFFDPIGTFVIADPQNWVALFSFLAVSLVASRLSDKAKQRAQDATARQLDIERLYTFSRAILLIESGESFPGELARKLAETFGLAAVVLYDRRSDQIHRAGPSDFEGMDDQLRESAINGTSFADAPRNRMITAVRLGSQPIASLALQGTEMQDSVLQGIANLVAIGLERARAQDLAHQVAAARESEQLRTTLIDAMAHEFKTPLTSIRAATTSLLAAPDQAQESRMELLRIADEEAERLKDLIDTAVEMARLDTAEIAIESEPVDVRQVVQSVVDSMKKEVDDRRIEIEVVDPVAPVPLDQRLVKLALKQLLDNALKYSTPGASIKFHIREEDGFIIVAIMNHGPGIAVHEQQRIFERFYRSPSFQHRIPGSGLGLSIAYRIAQAHGGDLTVTSHPGETTFRMTLPVRRNGASA